jgi:hypothetical protein
MIAVNEGHPPSPCYAVLVRKRGEWVQQSVEFTDYGEAQSHAKLVRRGVAFIERTRVRRLPHNDPAQF